MATPIAPWVSLTPQDYQRAATSGAELGIQIGRQRAAAVEAESAIQQAAARTALAYRQQADQVSQAQARLSSQERIAAMEAQVRKDIADKQFRINSQRADVEDAYRSSQIGLAGERLQQQRDIAEAKANDAAQVFADNQGFAEDIKNGLTVQEAAFRHPRVHTSFLSSLGHAVEAAKPKTPRYGLPTIYTTPDGHTFAGIEGTANWRLINEDEEKGLRSAMNQMLQQDYRAKSYAMRSAEEKDRPQLQKELDAIREEIKKNATRGGSLPEGATVRGKPGTLDEGKVFVIRNGKRVPVEQGAVPVEQGESLQDIEP